MILDTSAQDRVIAPVGNVGVWRRWLLPAVAAALLVATALWIALRWGTSTTSVSAERVRIATVKLGDLVRDIAVEGRVISARSTTLYAVAAGTVTLHVVAGDQVRQNQPLAEIDSPESRSRLVQEESAYAGIEAQARRAELDVKLAGSATRKQLDQVELERTAAERELQRYQRAYDLGVVPQVDLMRAKDTLQKADIGASHAREDVKLQGQGAELDARNKRQLAERQKAVVAEARRQVAALTLRAPFDGQVGQVQVAPFTHVAASAPVLGVVDLSVFEVEFEVPESFARELSVGMPAEVSSGSGESFTAEVSAVSAEVVNGEVTGRVRFRDRQPPGLRQSQRLNVRILMDTHHDVLQVERGPFVDRSGGSYAYVMDGNIAVKRPVRLGASSLDAIEVVDGLSAGDRVVVSGDESFDDAERIQVK